MITFRCKPFLELTPFELYDILHLRSEVFVVEQNCVFQDADYRDHGSYHLMAYIGDQLAGYTRLLPPGLAYDEMSIGRVVTSSKCRRTGIGRVLMKESIERCHGLFGTGQIKIGAQEYLQHFYESFGFMKIGEGYLEDGIPHIYMVLPPSTHLQ